MFIVSSRLPPPPHNKYDLMIVAVPVRLIPHPYSGVLICSFVETKLKGKCPGILDGRFSLLNRYLTLATMPCGRYCSDSLMRNPCAHISTRWSNGVWTFWRGVLHQQTHIVKANRGRSRGSSIALAQSWMLLLVKDFFLQSELIFIAFESFRHVKGRRNLASYSYFALPMFNFLYMFVCKFVYSRKKNPFGRKNKKVRLWE